MSHGRWMVAGVVAGMVLGCSGETDPFDQLVVDLSIEPATVVPGEEVTATLLVQNPTTRPVAVPHSGCAATIEVRHAEDRTLQYWKGGAGSTGCLLGEGYVHIETGHTFTETFDLTALARDDETWEYVVPPPPGAYVLRVRMGMPLPDIERSLIVRE